MPQIRIWIILFLLLTAFIGQAQDEDETQGWDIIERCVGEATEPPDDWTFDGTILATGWAGIHGINADSETPYVLYFNVPPRDDSWHVNGRAISPNGNWYSELHWSINELTPTQTGSTTYVRELIVASLTNRGEIYRIPFEQSERYEWGTFAGREVGFVEPYWWDETHVVVLNDLVNPFTGEISPLTAYRNHPNEVSLSPDRSREVTVATYYDYGGTLLFPKIGSYTPYRLQVAVWSVAWSNDSSVFAASVVNSERDEAIFLFDREGQLLIDNIYLGGIELGRFSHDDHYLTLLQSVDYSTRRLLIADVNTQIITDTCVEFQSHIWSPTTSQIAFMSSGQGQRLVHVFDLEEWQVYTVAYHDGRIIGWREDPE